MIVYLRTIQDIGDDGIPDDVAISVEIKTTLELAPLEFGIPNGETLFDHTRLGFGAGTGEGGALHRLLGVEIKVDGACVEPPLTSQLSGACRRDATSSLGRGVVGLEVERGTQLVSAVR